MNDDDFEKAFIGGSAELPVPGATSAAILTFPLVRRAGKIRRCAEMLEAKRGTAADGYWRKQLDDIAGQLERAGIDDETIRDQLREFGRAVQVELDKRAHAGRPPRTGGA